MNNLLKVLLTTLIIVYIISPVDLVPGPIDDVIVALAGLTMRKKLSDN